MTRTEAQKRADKKYTEKVRYTKNRPLNLTVKMADYAIIDDYARARNISKAALIVRAVKWCIVHDVDLTEAEPEDSGKADD